MRSITEASTLINGDAFRLFFEQSADGMLLLDGEVFINCNQAALDLLGYTTKAQLLSRTPADLSPATQPDGRTSIEKATELMQTAFNQGSLRFEWVHNRYDGESFPVEILLTALPIGRKKILLTVMRDISERKLAEDALRQLNESLEAQIESRTQELTRRRAVAESLREILVILNSDQALNEILVHILKQAALLLDCTAGATYHYIREEDLLRLEAGYALPPGLAAIQALPLYEGGAMRAMLRREPYIVSNIQTHIAQLKTTPTYLAFADGILRDWLDQIETNFGAYLGIPLYFKDEVYGTLGLYYDRPRDFSDYDIDLALSFGNQTALAIENARLRQQAQHAAVAAERNRLARDLHDSVTQTLFSASLIAEVLPRLWERNQPIAQAHLQDLRQLTRGAMAEMRTLLLELRPETLIKAPLAETLRHLVDATIGRASIPVPITIHGSLDLPDDVKVALYRITQEALNNVAKHAEASTASLTVQHRDGQIDLHIKDDGIGFDQDAVASVSLGLHIMRERADAINAQLTINSQPGKGTRIHVIWEEKEQQRDR